MGMIKALHGILTDQTLPKVREALVASGLSYDAADKAIISMQNFGILFREKPGR